MDEGALRHEVVHLPREILERDVPHVGARHRDDFDGGHVQLVRGVDRRGASLDVGHVGAPVGHDDVPLERLDLRVVCSNLRLEGNLQADARRYVEKRAAGPKGRIERGDRMIIDRDRGCEV